MKKTILLATFLISSTLAFCQKSLSPDYSYNISTPYKFFEASFKIFDVQSKYYFSKGNESVSLKFYKRDVFIQKFNNDKPAFIKSTLQEDFFPKNFTIESILEVGERIYLFYSSWNGKEHQEQLFSVVLDFEKGILSTIHKPIIIIKGKLAGNGEYRFFGSSLNGIIKVAGVQGKFDLIVSQDQSKILVKYIKNSEIKNDKKSYNEIGLETFDENLNKISEREIKMPYTERRMDNLDYQLDNEGNMYLLVKVYHDDSNDDKKRSKDELANYHLELFYIKNGSSDIEISKFDNKDKFVNKLWMFESSKDFLICGGYFSNGKGEELSDIDGVLAFKIDRKGKIYDETFHSIPIELINQYESIKTKKINKKDEEKGIQAKVTDLVLKNIIINDDGSLVLIGEQVFVISKTSVSSSGSSRTYTSYHYNDLFITKIGVDKDLKWMKKIPKSQAGVRGIGGMSFKYCNFNNHHYLMFMDNVKNINLPSDKTPEVYVDGKEGYLTAVKVSDSDGELSKSSILNGKVIKDFRVYQFAVSRVFQTSQNSFMFEVYKKKKEDVMIKVTLN